MLLQFLVGYNLNNDKALQGSFGCYRKCGHSTQSCYSDLNFFAVVSDMR